MVVGDQKNTLLSEINNGQVNAVAHTAYGYPTGKQPIKAQLRYNGEFTEPQTGTQLLGNGYRTYNFALMRFQSPDSLSPFGAGGVNTYAYCEGEPVLNVDPDGHSILGSLLRILRPTTRQAHKAGAPGSFLTNSKSHPVSVRSVATKDVQRLGKVVKLRRFELQEVKDSVGINSRDLRYVERYEGRHGAGSFRANSREMIMEAESNLENMQSLHRWAGKNVGKLGITKESSTQLKSEALKYDQKVAEIRSREKAQFVDWQLRQDSIRRRERAQALGRPKATKHYLGDGWS
ncbi:RHS repeat-associated core domain-containing protein [Pseudomonas moorei]|uniref:RHS repeat-associated core domain-containing protein n=1 Tax=Pseudomonas moorei TaxID=395599 RepID=UPI00200E7BB8|nr:RHS repeat-associated core domain-containing protein [Pseudomonas moorei]